MYNINEHSYLHNGSATKALQEMGDFLPRSELLKRTKRCIVTSNSHKGGKRQRASLQMGDLLSDLESVEDYIAFPTVEWAYDDDESSDSDFNISEGGFSKFISLENEGTNEEEDISTPLSPNSFTTGERLRYRVLRRSRSNRSSLSSLNNEESEGEKLSDYPEPSNFHSIDYRNMPYLEAYGSS
mmetsp:Transcript_18941/g.21712  ORF Transcript_18941/g.21712 Transcript_18941/m.21712 type:complete len:184 (-) Transcript_18941:31-582(-)